MPAVPDLPGLPDEPEAEDPDQIPPLWVRALRVELVATTDDQRVADSPLTWAQTVDGWQLTVLGLVNSLMAIAGAEKRMVVWWKGGRWHIEATKRGRRPWSS